MEILYDGGKIEQIVTVFAEDKRGAEVEATKKMPFPQLPEHPGHITIRAKEGFLDE